MPITLLASAARTAGGNAVIANVPHPEMVEAARVKLDVPAAATDAGDTLAVVLQGSDDGVTWTTFATFTTVLGNGGAKSFTLTWRRDSAVANQNDTNGTTVNGPAGTQWRIVWTIVDAGGNSNQSFTFGLTAMLLRARR